MTAYRSCRLGVDPELFIVDKNNNVVAAENFLPWKEEPLIVRNRETYHAKDSGSVGSSLHADGIAAEMTIGEGHCRAYLIDNIFYALKKLQKLIQSEGHKLCFDSAIETPSSFLDKVSDKGKEFGCDPEFIAWLDGADACIEVDENHPYRYAGGHIHIGQYEKINSSTASLYGTRKSTREKARDVLTNKKIELVKLLDILVGNTFVLIDQNETTKLRRKHYGKAGAFRPTSYGIEYRVLSNIILYHPSLTYLSLMLARAAVWLMMQEQHQKLLDLFKGDSLGDLILAINENDKELAFKNYERIKAATEDIRFEGKQYFTMIEYISKTGYKKVLADPYKSWRINTGRSSHHGSGVIDLGNTYATIQNKKDYKKYVKVANA